MTRNGDSPSSPKKLGIGGYLCFKFVNFGTTKLKKSQAYDSIADLENFFWTMEYSTDIEYFTKKFEHLGYILEKLKNGV